jgi:beta-mannanase
MISTAKGKRSGLYVIICILVVVLTGAYIKGQPYIRSVFYNDYYERLTEPVVGIYDRDHPAVSLAPVNLAHCTVVWKSTAISFDKKLLTEELKKGNTLITVEAWLKKYFGGEETRNVLYETIKGKFDSDIESLGKVIANSPHQVYVRWNPDMDVPAYQYPWQLQGPEMYIQAFNYVAIKLKHVAPRVKIVWGPSGFPGDTEYWPGPANVDYASITLGSVSEKSTDAYKFNPNVPELLRLKLHRMRFINKPVLIIGSPAANAGNFYRDLLTWEYAYMDKYKTTVYSPQNYSDSAAVKAERTGFAIGVFDPARRLLHDPNVSVEHMFVDLGEVERGEFKLRFDSVLARHHDVIVTMEPWKDVGNQPDSNALQSTLDGRYDARIKKLYSIISDCGQTVYLRWAHEMEIPIHRYAWQSKDPVTYINAFRYFMLFDKGHAKNIRRVWGPAGDRGSADWWPGSDVVDFISVAIYGLPDKNITDPNKQEPFSTIFKRKYYRMRFLNRPLFVTEIGVKGPEDYQRNWLKGAAETLKANKHVFGVCYFNLYDNPKAWGGIKAPDWSISPQNMKIFSGYFKDTGKQE